MIALLLTSPFLLARAAWPALRASGDGRFIAIASVHGLVASPYKSAYVSAKHGVLGLVKTLALEGADDGIVAAAVCPGYVRTPLVEHQVAAQAEAHGMPEERVLEEVILAPHAVKRLIEPDEVADVVAFLFGPDRPLVHRRGGHDGPGLVGTLRNAVARGRPPARRSRTRCGGLRLQRQLGTRDRRRQPDRRWRPGSARPRCRARPASAHGCLRRPRRWPCARHMRRATARRRAQHDAAHALRVPQRHLLGDHPAERDAVHVGGLHPRCVEHRDGVVGHLRHAVGPGRALERPAPRLSNARTRRPASRSTGTVRHQPVAAMPSHDQADRRPVAFVLGVSARSGGLLLALGLALLDLALELRTSRPGRAASSRRRARGPRRCRAAGGA